MNPLDIIEIGAKLLDKIIPDKDARAKAQEELLKAAQDQSFQLQLGQIEINKEEAKNPSLFVSGWRPAAGWTCVTALALTYIPKAIVLTGFWCYQTYLFVRAGNMSMPPFPELGVADIIGLLGALLGIGAMRSIDKYNGVDTK